MVLIPVGFFSPPPQTHAMLFWCCTQKCKKKKKKYSDPATRHGCAWGQKSKPLLLILNLGTRWGEWLASRPGRALPPGKGPPVPIVQEAGWAPEPVWTQRLEEKSSASVGDRIPVVQSVVRHYTDWATPAPSTLKCVKVYFRPYPVQCLTQIILYKISVKWSIIKQIVLTHLRYIALMWIMFSCINNVWYP
jgi:hypothetical protein